MSSDPQRLLEAGSEAPAKLRELLRQGLGDLPNSAELGRLEAKLGPIFAAPPGAAPAPPPATEVAALSSGAKAVGAALIVAAVIGVGALVAVRSSHPTAPSAPPAAGAPPAIHEAEQPKNLPSAGSLAPPPTDVEPPAAEETPSPARAARPAPSGPSEVQLLEQARAALASDPARALALAQEHKRRFAKGALAQEREVIAIEALARLGDSEHARKRAKEFEDRYPNSAHRRKVGASAPTK